MKCITGTWVKGLETAGKFVKHPGYILQFKEKLGFKPFPGTLNVQVNVKELQEIKTSGKSVLVLGFNENGKEFSEVQCIPCKINEIQGAIVIPEKTTHAENIMEVISPFGLVEKLKLKVGDKVNVEVE